MPFSIGDLFQANPSGVDPGNPSAVPPAGSWLDEILSDAQTLGLTTTSWQSGGMVRTILAIMATAFAQEDAMIALIAQGGFLDFAASGVVPFTSANGVTTLMPVSPDPSVPGQNPTGAPTWLDLLADSVYNVQRIGATQASGTLAIANATSNTYGPFAVGTYHVSNPTSGAGYSNAGSLTIAPANFVGGGITAATNTAPIQVTTASAHGLTSGQSVFIAGCTGNANANGFWIVTVIDSTHFQLVGSVGSGSGSTGTVNVCTTGTFAADLAGPSGTSVARTITQATTTLSGVSVSNLVSFFGQNYESNTQLAARCRLKLQSLSPGGPSGAYQFFALSASQILAAQTPPVILSAPITRVLVQTSSTTGVVTTTVANAAGAISGISNLAVTGATNAAPIVITTATHGLSTGNYVTIKGVQGNTNANGTRTITVLSPTTFSLDGSVGNAAYTTGGTVEGGDLGEVDAVIQANAVPDDVTAITQSASGFNVAIVATVTVPLATVATYATAVQTALANYFASLPIGGLIGTGNKILLNDVIGVLYQAGSTAGGPSNVLSITGVTLNGVAADLSYPSATSVAQLSPTPVITVIGA